MNETQILKPFAERGNMIRIEIGSQMDTSEEFCLDISSIITGRTFLASITRWGKCLDSNSLISIPNGDLISIREFVDYAKSEVCTKYDSNLVSGKVKAHFKEQKQIAFLRIEPRHGPWIECSVDHYFPTKDGWKKASELSKKDKILLAPNEGNFGNLVLPNHEIKLLAYLIAEGSLSKGTGFTNTNEVIQKDFQDALREFDPTLLVKPSGATVWLSSGKKQGSAYRNKLLQWLIYNQLYPSKSRTKSIPHNVLQLKEECLALFLNRLFAGDGSCSIYARKLRHSDKPVVKIEYCTTSPMLAIQIPLLLMRFGIFTSVYRIESPKRPYWRLQIAQVHSIKNFLKKIGIFGKDTRLAFDYVSGKLPTNALERDGAFVWDAIRRISSIATPATMFDLSIQTTNNYVANGMIVHNSWTARKLTEECFGHAGIIIIDPEGEYASLREKYPFLIIGKDIPMQIETAEFMAEKILETKTSVIIDLSTTEEELGKEYVDAFLKRFFFMETTIRSPYLVVVEEAEDFAPEKGIATATCLDILRNIAKKGGKRGIGLLLIAHRPAWVSKGVLSQCANKAIGRIDWPGDLAVIEEYLRIPHAMTDRLPVLGKGEFLFIGDWVDKTAFIKVGPVKTTHLGYTPEVIPPSPRELQSVIASLQKSLPQILEKIKPTVLPIAEMKAEVRKELEQKYQDKISGITRTADEKAERKFKTKIDELQEHMEKLSRAQALQPTSPITDVLEHPIVKTRMLELPDKSRDLLIKIEREPNQTREQLAAFLTTSTNSIAYMIERVNQVFRATAIIGEGKPLRYKSVLKRLFITDVGKREIEELSRLQGTIMEQKATIASLEPQIEELRRKRVEVNQLGQTIKKLELENEAKRSQIATLECNIQNLEREKQGLTASNKVASAFKTALDLLIDEKVSNIRPNSTQADPNINEQMVNSIIEKKINEKLASMPATSGIAPTSVSLEHKVTHFDFQKQEEHLKTDTTNLQGRIIFMITRGFFDQRHNRKEVVTELSNNGWVHDDREVDAALLELCTKGIFYRKISTGNIFWYTLQPEAKNHITAKES